MRYLPVSATPQPLLYVAEAPRNDEVHLHFESVSTLRESPTHPTKTKTSGMSPHLRLQFLCVLLHCGLVAIHIALFVVYLCHFEHSVTFDINSFSTNWLPSIVSGVSQAIGTVRCPLLLISSEDRLLNCIDHIGNPGIARPPYSTLSSAQQPRHQANPHGGP